MVFFRHMSNGQSAAAWVLCGVLCYVYTQLEERDAKLNEERNMQINGRPSDLGPQRKK